ncbi:branched-chain-amino-acid aminotransferase-like protein 1 [Physcomitrium patens]|uniref:Uncharacterized protein n=1 Tax=Physcomitrium patens TaxID=3218 RepID=A0A2K1KEF5_PHYPA|nr:branched-chain-amino-acid aminotransferase-like protein 1 [Physcomitrium patens]PNR52161.1 hypothetical protein PHYPA_008535 [Physcomitrium patens]|eukprot:XP_024378737.1 branched-chain-amino-acid aminotransferase-like protein 1 [Physcomitrella patens]
MKVDGEGFEVMGEEKSRDCAVEVINVWSGPRSLSTSLMYSFAQRDDTEVLDEPLYAHYLRLKPNVCHPSQQEVLDQMENDGNKVVREIIHGPCKKKYRYAKHMAKQRTPCLTKEVLRGRHVLLIRNPLEFLPSFDKVLQEEIPELEMVHLASLYMELRSMHQIPPIIDATDLRRDPEGMLRSLCSAIDIPFQSSMLSWKAGPRPEDGVWAPWWYSSVHKSTEFVSPPPFANKPFPKRLYKLLEQNQPFYDFLKREAILPIPAPAAPPPLPCLDNKELFVWVNGQILPRNSAKVSVFDSIVQGGDGVWEGLRIYKGKVFKLEEHLDRLFDSAKAMAFANIPSREEVKRAVFATLIANDMRDNAHVRLTLTRGEKTTSGMSPAFNVYGCTLIVLSEWKPPVYNNTDGIRLITASTRRNSPNSLDSKIHHNNLINNILAKVEGNIADAGDALMLDCGGFVAETNATNIFMVKKGRVLTPHADYCLPGITRATVIDLARREGFPMEERRISLTEFHTADEVWTTGTMGELTPVTEIDGRQIGDGKVGPVTKYLQAAYSKLAESEGEIIPFR